jgi:MFS transporter, DHA2 family, methylenomycin A resistance protein
MANSIDTAKPAAVPSANVAAGRRRQRAALAVAMLGFAVVALDAQITNVALPAIHRHLGGGLAGLQWVITGYTLMFSALLLFGGTLADRAGSKSTYRYGMLLFVAASAACGMAPSLPLLVGARLVQGVGAALVTPTCLSLIREASQDAGDRARAIAYWALGGSVAAAAGPVLGGVLVQADWRLIFFINLPIGVAALTVLTRVADSSRRRTQFDWAGQATAVLGLAALTYACIEGGSVGFTSSAVIGAFFLSAAAGVTFLITQARGWHPMMPLTLFRSRPVAITLAVAFITMAGFYGLVFLQSLYFQQVRGHSALVTGLLFLPMTALVALTNPLVARIARRFGRLTPIIAGQVSMAGGFIALATMPVTTPVWLIAVLMIFVGVGGAFTVPPIASLILDSVPASLAGAGSGVLNTFRQMGGSLGVAVFGAIVDASAHFETGLRISFTGTAVLLGAAALATFTLRRLNRPAG